MNKKSYITYREVVTNSILNDSNQKWTNLGWRADEYVILDVDNMIWKDELNNIHSLDEFALEKDWREYEQEK